MPSEHDTTNQNKPEWYDIDRPRGILAPVDREYVIGEKQYNDRQMSYQRRETIKERFREAILDMALLFDTYDETYAEDLFPPSRSVDPAFHDALPLMLGLVYRERPDNRPFQNLLLRAVEAAERQLTGNPELMYNIKFDASPIETIDLNEAIELFKSGKWRELDEAQQEALVRLFNRARKEQDLDPDLEQLLIGLDDLVVDYGESREEEGTDRAVGLREKEQRRIAREREKYKSDQE